jgi:hypothetical protein
MRTFLFYWTTEQVVDVLELGILPHAGSNQFKRVSVGDRIWITGRARGTHELFVVGYLDVALKMDEEAAQERMDQIRPGFNVWPADWHVFAKPGNECHTREVSMVPVYGRLSFDSPKNRRLALTAGHPNAQQLQTMRLLTADGAARMLELWGKR